MKTELKKKFLPNIALGIFFGSMLFSVCMYLINGIQPYRVYYFRSFDSDSVFSETRRAAAKPESGELEYYIDDILLGPITNRYKPLFAPGTSVEFCIKKGKELHLGLTAKALKPDSETCSIPDGVELLKKNIVSNFTNIKKIHIYIGGRPAGE